MLETDNHKRNSLNYSILAGASATLAPAELYGSWHYFNKAYNHYKELAEIPKGMVLTGNPLVLKNMWTRKMVIESGLSLSLFLAALAAPFAFYKLAKRQKRLALEREVNQ